jgi:hypothetical protein
MLRAATARTMQPTSMNMARRFSMRHHRTALRMPGKRLRPTSPSTNIIAAGQRHRTHEGEWRILHRPKEGRTPVRVSASGLLHLRREAMPDLPPPSSGIIALPLLLTGAFASPKQEARNSIGAR